MKITAMLAGLILWCNVAYGQVIAPCSLDESERFSEECKAIDVVLEALRKGALERTLKRERNVGGIDVTIYSPLLTSVRGVKEVEVVVFNTVRKRVLVFQYLYETGGTALEERRRKDVFARFVEDVLLLDLKGLTFGKHPKFRVIGHSDLQRATIGKNYDTYGECAKAKIATDTNECVALTRAHDLADILRGKTDAIAGPKTIISHSADFFLREVNEETGGQLLVAIGAKGTVDTLSKRWGLQPQYIARDVRARDDIQGDITANLQDMRQRFAPFRAVVVIVD